MIASPCQTRAHGERREHDQNSNGDSSVQHRILPSALALRSPAKGRMSAVQGSAAHLRHVMPHPLCQRSELWRKCPFRVQTHRCVRDEEGRARKSFLRWEVEVSQRVKNARLGYGRAAPLKKGFLLEGAISSTPIFEQDLDYGKPRCRVGEACHRSAAWRSLRGETTGGHRIRGVASPML